MSEIRLPALGAEMEEGTLLEWYVKPGDQIAYGDVIALLDTEKAEIEMDAFESGTIEALLIEPGQTVSVGDPIATLSHPEAKAELPRSPDTAPPTPDVELRPPAPEKTKSAASARPQPSTETKVEPTHATSEPTRIRATPLARRIAKDRGVDLSRLAGSGPAGAIVEADIPDSGPEPSQPAKPSRASRRRDIIAAAMTRSKREIPHYYLSTSIEVRTANDWLAAHNLHLAASDRVVLSALLMKSVARAARRFPEMNGHWLKSGFRASKAVHLGMVVSLRTGGIVVPTFRDADQRPLDELMLDLRDVVGRARAGRLRSSELGDATLTLTSLGDDGADAIFGVIYPPQVAIVGFGGVHPAVRSEGDLFGIQPVIQASLSADHRASDGQRGSQFLAAIERGLRNPDQL